MDAENDLRLGQAENVVVAFEGGRVIREQTAAKIRFCQALFLDHRAHGAIENQNPALGNLFQRGKNFGFLHIYFAHSRISDDLAGLCRRLVFAHDFQGKFHAAKGC